MENNSSIHIQQCIPHSVAYFICGITITTIPFHVLIIKVLIVDLRLALPRHNTMLCLTISDALQVFMFFLCMTTPSIFNFSRESVGCEVSRTILYFIIAQTLAVSSLSTIALSVERCVACIHSFYLHLVFTTERMRYGISVVWIVGLTCGSVAVTLTLLDQMTLNIKDNIFMKVISVLFIIPTSILLCIIQFRLLVFSRKKLVQVRPGKQFGCEAEIADFRKKQVKVAFVASVVVVAYIVCMAPMGFFSLYELIVGKTSDTLVRSILEKLLLVNNFVDPFIYGIGTVDARRASLKNLEKIRDFITRRFYK